MFAYIKHSYVMGNASKHVKEIAKKNNASIKILPDIMDDGLAHGIKQALRGD
jgi:hydroxymethylpyrimidine pyrophosphatase-like HAD family hydrolase